MTLYLILADVLKCDLVTSPESTLNLLGVRIKLQVNSVCLCVLFVDNQTQESHQRFLKAYWKQLERNMTSDLPN